MMVPEFRDQPIGFAALRNRHRADLVCKIKLGKGQRLAKVERGTGPGRGITEKKITGFTSFLRDLGMTKPTAIEAQRIGCMPKDFWRPEVFHHANGYSQNSKIMNEGRHGGI